MVVVSSMAVPSLGLDVLLALLLGRSPGLGGRDQPEIPAMLVMEASRHSAAQLQPVLLELPHPLPLSVAWPGGLPCPWNRGTVDTVACREATRGKR
jgi:hypothetical protein